MKNRKKNSCKTIDNGEISTEVVHPISIFSDTSTYRNTVLKIRSISTKNGLDPSKKSEF